MARYVEVPSPKLFSMLNDAGFIRLAGGAGREVVFECLLGGHGDALGYLAIRVYTSVREGASKARRRGADAIRVTLHWDPGASYMEKIVGYSDNVRTATKGLYSERVFRAGTIEGVLDRTKTRMREAWALGLRVGCCSKCGGPTWPDSQRCAGGC